MTAMNHWAAPFAVYPPPDTPTYGAWDASQAWGPPSPGRKGSRRIGVVLAIVALAVVTTAVIGFVLLFALPAGVVGCGGG
jgi:hypothetical protein